MRYFVAACSGLALCLFMSRGIVSAGACPNPGFPSWVMGNQGKGHGSQGRGGEHGNGHGEHGRGHYKNERSRVAFSVHDREVIRNYFREYPSSLPPGLAKRGGDLPPGLEKHLRENGTLPPGLEKRLRPCPAGLVRRLPPLPEGYSRRMLGPRLLILDRANVIVDIMFLAR
jgi:hypothetical protein